MRGGARGTAPSVGHHAGSSSSPARGRPGPARPVQHATEDSQPNESRMYRNARQRQPPMIRSTDLAQRLPVPGLGQQPPVAISVPPPQPSVPLLNTAPAQATDPAPRFNKPNPRRRKRARELEDESEVEAALLQDSNHGSPVTSSVRPPRPPAAERTCPAWLHNRCKKGSSCHYRHDIRPLQDTPVGTAGAVNTRQAESGGEPLFRRSPSGSPAPSVSLQRERQPTLLSTPSHSAEVSVKLEESQASPREIFGHPSSSVMELGNPLPQASSTSSAEPVNVASSPQMSQSGSTPIALRTPVKDEPASPPPELSPPARPSRKTVFVPMKPEYVLHQGISVERLQQRRKGWVREETQKLRLDGYAVVDFKIRGDGIAIECVKDNALLAQQGDASVETEHDATTDDETVMGRSSVEAAQEFPTVNTDSHLSPHPQPESSKSHDQPSQPARVSQPAASFSIPVKTTAVHPSSSASAHTTTDAATPTLSPTQLHSTNISQAPPTSSTFRAVPNVSASSRNPGTSIPSFHSTIKQEPQSPNALQFPPSHPASSMSSTSSERHELNPSLAVAQSMSKRTWEQANATKDERDSSDAMHLDIGDLPGEGSYLRVAEDGPKRRKLADSPGDPIGSYSTTENDKPVRKPNVPDQPPMTSTMELFPIGVPNTGHVPPVWQTASSVSGTSLPDGSQCSAQAASTTSGMLSTLADVRYRSIVNQSTPSSNPTPAQPISASQPSKSSMVDLWLSTRLGRENGSTNSAPAQQPTPSRASPPSVAKLVYLSRMTGSNPPSNPAPAQLEPPPQTSRPPLPDFSVLFNASRGTSSSNPAAMQYPRPPQIVTPSLAESFELSRAHRPSPPSHPLSQLHASPISPPVPPPDHAQLDLMDIQGRGRAQIERFRNGQLPSIHPEIIKLASQLQWFLPQAATTSRAVSLHFLTQEDGRTACVLHSSGARVEGFVVEGRPCLDCGCDEESVLMEWVWWKTWKAADGVEPEWLSPRMRYVFTRLLKDQGKLALEDFWGSELVRLENQLGRTQEALTRARLG